MPSAIWAWLTGTDVRLFARISRHFIDTGFTAHHDVVEYWDGGALKVFRGIVTMTPDDKSQGVVRPTMTHFFYMDEADPTKVSHWYGAVGPVRSGDSGGGSGSTSGGPQLRLQSGSRVDASAAC